MSRSAILWDPPSERSHAASRNAITPRRSGLTTANRLRYPSSTEATPELFHGTRDTTLHSVLLDSAKEFGEYESSHPPGPHGAFMTIGVVRMSLSIADPEFTSRNSFVANSDLMEFVKRFTWISSRWPRSVRSGTASMATADGPCAAPAGSMCMSRSTITVGSPSSKCCRTSAATRVPPFSSAVWRGSPAARSRSVA